MSKIDFTLYGRSYCHLCDEMLSALLVLCVDEEANGSFHGQYTVTQIDIDTEVKLIDLYDELVPVLIGTKADQVPVQLCHYFFDYSKVKDFVTTKLR
ncbi:glutaredoxin family protein [Glaciimonas sp. GG7]